MCSGSCSACHWHGPGKPAGVHKGDAIHSQSFHGIAQRPQAGAGDPSPCPAASGKGVVVRAVKDAQGRIYKQVVRNGVPSPAPESRVSRRAGDSSSSFYEGFEGWDGQAQDWIPSGWTEINTDGNKPTQLMLDHHINNTWQATYTGDGYWTAITTDGEKECFIHFPYDAEIVKSEGDTLKIPRAASDEWLITPEFTVAQNDKLFFLLEIDLGSIYSYDWNTRAYDHSKAECDLEVLASEDGGQNWSRLWLASQELLKGMSDSELYNEMASLKYHSVGVDISKYYGKKVKLAFRYINTAASFVTGNSMAVDGVNVGRPQAEASYMLPQSTLLFNFTPSLLVFNNSIALMPAYTPVNWTHNSNAYTESVKWNFYDPATEANTIELTDAAPAVTNPYSEGSFFPYPVLTASNAFSTDTFSIDETDKDRGGIVYGGTITPYQGENLGVGNADYVHKGFYAPYFNDSPNHDNYVYGTSAADTWGTGVTEIAVGNLFTAPQAPFVIDSIYVPLTAFQAADTTQFTLNVWSIDKWDQLSSSPLATATAKASDVKNFDGLYQIPFKFYSTDAQGKKVAAPFVYDQQILVEVNGFQDTVSVKKFAMCSQMANNDADHNYAYIKFHIESNGRKFDTWYKASEALRDYSNAIYMSLMGYYNFLKPDTSHLSFTTEGGTQKINVQSPVDCSKWWIVYDGDRYELGSTPAELSWLSVTASGKQLSLTAHSSAAERSLSFDLVSNGASATIQVDQTKLTGVNVVDSAKAVAGVTYVNLAGQKSATPFSGVNIVITRYTDGSTTAAKVVK